MVTSTHAQQKTPDQNSQPKREHSFNNTQKISYKLISAINLGYGYDIFIDTALVIHQPAIPCIPGNKGFKSKNDARNVAILVMDKIRKGIFPPAVTISEMQKLGIDLR